VPNGSSRSEGQSVDIPATAQVRDETELLCIINAILSENVLTGRTSGGKDIEPGRPTKLHAHSRLLL
jgi:hypothetical protein